MSGHPPLAPLARLLFTLVLPIGATAAVEVERVGDINQVGADSSPQDFVELGSARLFTAFTPATGRELFISRGGAADTELLKDITPGPGDTDISGLQPAVLEGTNVAVFWTGGFRTGGELWRTDGTEAGTFAIVSDITVRNMAPVPGRGLLVFDGDDGVSGQEPWVTDGTTAGTQQLADVNSGSAGSTGATYVAIAFVVSGDRIYFPADDGVAGTELWTSDGTPGGTAMVDELVEDGFEDRAFRVLEADGAGGLYFGADVTGGAGGGPNDRAELWFSANGTAGNTAQVPFDGDYTANTNIRGVRVLPGGEVYFADGQFELFLTDGAATERVLVDGTTTPFAPSVQDLSQVIMEFDDPRFVDPRIYALGQADGSTDPELWRLDAATAVEISDIGPDDPERNAPRALTVVGSNLLFSADDGTSGSEPWRSDGTTAGTTQVADIAAGAASGFVGIRGTFAPTATGLIFAGSDTEAGSEPWFSSGTTAGTARIADLRPGTGDAQVTPFSFGPLGDAILLSAIDGETGRELWRVDDSGVSLVKDIRAGADGSSPNSFAVLDGKLYFAASTEAEGGELWVSDGSEAGTMLLGDLDPGPSGIQPRGLTRAGDRLIFRACCDDQNRYEVWVSDGTEGGTQQLLDINPSGGSDAGDFTAISARVYFRADDGGNGSEPWRSDGTAGGTVRITDVNTGGANSNPTVFLPLGDQVYFEATDNAVGREPRIYDPQMDSVTLLRNINGDSSDSVENDRFRGNAVSTGDAVYFAASDAASGREPWVTDGTSAGTRRLGDIAAGAEDSSPLGFTLHDGAVYFSATEPATGRELYRYDPGTDALTRITDLAAGPADGVNTIGGSGGVSRLLVLDDRLFFAGIDAAGGAELWSTAGTTADTRQERDIREGAVGSAPALIAVIDDTLYFTADDGQTGDEVWRATAVSESDPDDSGSGSSGGGGGGGGGGFAGIAELLLLGFSVAGRRLLERRAPPRSRRCAARPVPGA